MQNMKHKKELVQLPLQSLPPTVRARNDAARGHRQTLAAMTPKDGEQFRTRVAQSDIIGLTGLGGVAASAFGGTAAGVAAAMKDAGETRQTARNLGAYTSDVGGQSAGGSTQPLPGSLGTVNLEGRRAATVEALEKALLAAPQNCAAARVVQRRRNREAGLSTSGSGAAEEMLGSSNTYFCLKGRSAIVRRSGACHC